MQRPTGTHLTSMKSLRALLALPLLAGSLASAQGPVPVYVAPSPAPAPSEIHRSRAQLEQLVAPVALYPDALLAIMLPASTAPTDLVLAARQMRENPRDAALVEARPWDESVKSLTAHPDVLLWMDDNLDWTRQLGEAFASQPGDFGRTVMALLERDYGRAPLQKALTAPVEGRPALATAVR